MTLSENKEQTGLVVITFIAMTFMKFRIASVTLSDIFLIVCFAIYFIRSGSFKLSLFAYLMASFVLLAIALALLQGGGQSLMSALKLIVPLFIVMSAGTRFENFSTRDVLSITRGVLLFGLLSQMFIVVLFYSGLFSSFFNVVEPGNINRDTSDFKINVFHLPVIGLYRFCSIMIEPSWYAFYFGFFLLLYFYQCRACNEKIKLREDLLIICAFLLTLSFTGIVFLVVAYGYRFYDSRYPLRLTISIPLLIIFLVWVMVTNDYLAHRAFLISTGKDASFNARIFESLDKTLFILNYTDWFGAAPGKTLDLINRYFQENLSIQNGYLEAFAATGLLGGTLFILIMHYSFFVFRSFYLQIPLILTLCVSSVVFTPIFWIFSFYLLHVARAHQSVFK